jgi:tricorn protease
MYRSAIRFISLALKPTARAALIGLACSFSGPALGQPLMRFPTVSATAIAFVAYNNLWAVTRRGGALKRLTDDPGQILMPHFSPDGRSLAFTWVREGGSDVYVMPAGGGTPTRLTHGPTLDSYDNVVTGWTPDGSAILFLSLRKTPFHRYETFEVPVTGGLAKAIGLDHSGTSSLSPDGQRIAYDPTFRNLGGDRWKHYAGGQAPDIYIQDLHGNRRERLTDWPGIDTAPMWIGNRIYFLSDRGVERRANLWVTDLGTKKTWQLTHFADYDIDMPSAGAGSIAFQVGGQLELFDIATASVRPIKVVLPVDARIERHEIAGAAFVRRNDLAGYPDYALGADGATAYLVVRGHLMALGADGTARTLTHSSGAVEDHPVVSPDGRTLAFVTDAGGEQQVAVMAVAGDKPPRLLTRFRNGVLYAPRWSPDGTHLLIADANKRLWLVATSDGHTVQIAVDPFAEIHDATFSADGKQIAYSTTRQNQMRALHVRTLLTDVDTVISPPSENDHDPAFSADGGHLYFISQRREQPFLSDRDREGTVATFKSDMLFELALPRSKSPVALTNATARATPVAIDLKGGIAALERRGTALFYRATAASGIGDELPGESSGLHSFDTLTHADRVVASDVSGYALSPDGRTALIRRGDGWHRIAATVGATLDSRVSLGGLRLEIDPHAEYQAMFEQAWRLDRDLFWDPKMNGVDWRAMHARYARLAFRIGSHEDLLYVLGEMQGELATSHMFVGGGDSGDSRPHVSPGLLGVDFAVDSASGRYRLARIYRGDPSRPRFRAPLGDAGLDVHDGDYLLAIDGQPLVAPDDPYRLLLGKQAQVRLTVAPAPDAAGHVISINTVDDETEIRKLDWIAHNAATVDRLSGGRTGYLYLSNFDALGSEDFVRQYYPQTDKAGLIIDIRDNTGGFTSQWVLDVLRRPLAGRFRNREAGVTTLPGAVAPRALAVVTNLFSMSDGDQFPYYFRQWKMGTVVGQRTWGGVRGIKGPWRLTDGTYVTVPKDSLFAADGAAIIENRGAEPDIVVDDRPADHSAGDDPQLEAAVAATLHR